MLLHAAASEVQPSGGKGPEIGTSRRWIAVTDQRSGIAGAKLFQLDDRHREMLVPLTDPEWRSSSAADYMEPGDPVLGLSVHGKNWAVPLWMLGGPHVANLAFDGEPVLVMFCGLCRSGIARSAVVNGRRLSFHAVGVYNGSFLLADYETNSYWTPFTGEALEGALKGAKLKQLPLIQCRWDRWLQMHPQTLVAYGRQGQVRRYGQAQALASGRVSQGFLASVLEPLDNRLPVNDLVLGVTLSDTARAYPLSSMDTGKDSDGDNIAVNDTLGGEPVVILHARGGTLTTAFSRRLHDKILQFATDKDGRFTDLTYHSHWNYDGEAVDGTVAGQKLSDIPSQIEDWYIWAAFHPTTSIYQGSPLAHD